MTYKQFWAVTSLSTPFNKNSVRAALTFYVYLVSSKFSLTSYFKLTKLKIQAAFIIIFT